MKWVSACLNNKPIVYLSAFVCVFIWTLRFAAKQDCTVSSYSTQSDQCQRELSWR
jgi:hypothetical protein